MAHKDRQHAIMGGGMPQGALSIQAFYAPAQGTEFHEQVAAVGAGAARVGCILLPNTLLCLIEIIIRAGFVFSEQQGHALLITWAGGEAPSCKLVRRPILYD